MSRGYPGFDSNTKIAQAFLPSLYTAAQTKLRIVHIYHTEQTFRPRPRPYRFTRSLTPSLTGGSSMVTMASASRPLKRCQEAISTLLSSPHSSKLFVAGIAPN